MWFLSFKKCKKKSHKVGKLLLQLLAGRGRCVRFISRSSGWNESLQPSTGVVSDKQVSSTPLNVIIGVEEAALPQPCELFRLLLCGIPRHCGEHHHGPALLGQFQQLFGFGGVNFGEVDGRRGPLVLREVAFLDVIILLWDRESQWILLQ